MTEDFLSLGDSVTVTDPCYVPNSLGHMAHTIYINPGEYFAYVEEDDSGVVGKLGINRGPNFHKNNRRWIGTAGVDSGQMMIISTDAIEYWVDSEYDDDSAPELSYAGACRLTLSDEKGGILENLAVVSSSGYGDGGYPVWAYEGPSGQIERIEVEFVGEEDEDESWSDDWDDMERSLEEGESDEW
jgi:hypothetical protein